MSWLLKFAGRWATKKVGLWVGGAIAAALIGYVFVGYKTLRSDHATLQLEHASLESKYAAEVALRASEKEQYEEDIRQMEINRTAINDERLAVQKRAFIEAGKLKAKLKKYEDAANYYDIPINEHLRLYRCQKAADLYSKHDCTEDTARGGPATYTTSVP